MSRTILLLLSSGIFAFAAMSQTPSVLGDEEEGRQALEQALAAEQSARQRSEEYLAAAAMAQETAQQAALESAAMAARIQQAEAGLAATELRIDMIAAQQEGLREELGRQSQPLVRLTAALQQFSRRPTSVSIFREGEISQLVHLRAILDSAVPVVEQRTAYIQEQMNRSRLLQDEAQQAALSLREEEQTLHNRRSELALIEAEQAAAAELAGANANREVERALALADQASDLDELLSEFGRAAALRAQLAALPGPVLRPADPSAGAELVNALPLLPIGDGSAPDPYILPVTGNLVTGFGAPQGNGLSQGLILSPIAEAQITAPAAGRVSFAGSYRGYGEIVIIEHSGGWTSLITGLARVDVNVGEQLVDAAPLGIAGAQAPMIGLELRRDGVPVNPLAPGE